MITGRDQLIYLSIYYHGDHHAIIEAARKKFEYDHHQVESALASLKCNVLTFIDKEYPDYLKKMPCPPVVLFYYGDISLIDDYHHKYNLAVVGTRKATEYGLYHTDKIVKEVAKDCNIVSGLAIGIDAQAHQAALEAGAKTIAVLGSGIDYPWPYENAPLYQEIINSGGLVISEYPNLTPPNGFQFPFRNRLIAMFSQALLVTEAYGFRSGTSITVTVANGLGMDVMVLPHPLDREDSFCNHLLYEGAKFVRNGRDILIDMDLEEIKII